MSANTLAFACIGTDTPALTHLHQLLQACIGVKSEQWPKLLQECFEDCESPYVMSASLRGQTLRFVVDSSANDELEKPHILALHAAGAEHIRLRTWYGQVGETRTLYLHAGKRVSAKSFPAPTLSEEERLYELVLEGKDAALAKEIKAGAPPDAVVDGRPLFVHVARAGMPKSLEALFDAKANLGLCLPWVHEVVPDLAYRDSKKTEAMLRALLGVQKAGASAPAVAPCVDAAALWCTPVLRGLGQFPALLAWLVAQDGVDVNAMLLFAPVDGQPLQEIGSLLFNSVEFFKDDPGVLAALAARGARSVAPPGMSDARRIDRTRDFSPTGSVLERVRQRHAAHADDTDAAVLKALEQLRGVTAVAPIAPTRYWQRPRRAQPGICTSKVGSASLPIQHPSCVARSVSRVLCRSLPAWVDTSLVCAAPNSSGRSTYMVRSPQPRAAARSSWWAATSATWPGSRSKVRATPR
jgi:hypothetical protein